MHSKHLNTFLSDHLQSRENLRLLLPPLDLRLYTGCHLDEIFSKSFAGFEKSKSAEILRIQVSFINKTFRYCFYAYIRNIPKIVTFVIEKMKLASFSFFRCFPP